MRDCRLAAVTVAVVVLCGPTAPATASSRRGHRPALTSAAVISGGSGGMRVALRWSQRVRIVHPGRVRFVTDTRAFARGAPITRRPGRTQDFTLTPGARIVAVKVARGVARGRGGRSRRGRVRLVSTGAPAAPPAAGGGSGTGPVPLSGSSPGPPAASTFVDSVGVDIHANYLDTPYSNSEAVVDELVKLGVHHVRDGACISCTQQRQTLMSLAAAGVKTDFIMGQPGGSESLSSLVDLVAGPMRPAVASLEGPNEWDNSGDRSWASDLRAYQQDLYQRVKVNAQLAGIPVLGPSMAFPQDYGTLGSLASSLDEGNIHPYPSDQLPDTNLDPDRQAETATGGPSPMEATEAGYNNALAEAGSSLRPVSESAAAAYVPRLVLDFFNAGIPRTYVYELIDEHADSPPTKPEEHFGLLRNDLSEKPAYQTLRGLLNAVAPATTQAFTSSGLDYWTATGPNLRYLLLQRGPGSYALVLWRDVSVWDSQERRDVSVSPAPATVTFGPDVTSITEVPIDGSSPTPITRSASNQPITVSLAGMPVVLELQRSSA